VADNGLDRDGQRRFVNAFAATMHAGAGRRKKGYIAAAVAAVVIAGGAAVAVGAASGHKSAPPTSNAQLSALGRTASPSPTPTAKKSKASAPSTRKPAPKTGTVKVVTGTVPAVEDTAAAQAAPPPSVHTGAPVVASGGGSGSGTDQGSSSSASTSSSSSSSGSSSATTTNTPSSSNSGNSPAPTTAPASSGSFAVSGTVSCVSGDSVEGVWVQADDGAGWAPWVGLGNGSTSTWSFTLPEQESYSLHIGCGGTTASWAVADYSPAITAATSAFNCVDVSTEANYGACVAR
jgi:hypothetical protein